MKIEKLYTLSQFIDLVASHDKDSKDDYYNNEIIIKEAYGNGYLVAPYILDKIIQYNEFLKQKLTKEMFVNEFEKPEKIEHYLKYGQFGSLLQSEYQECLKWKEAEKKMILGNNGIRYFALMCNYQEEGKTLHDLAERTNGQSKLKNIEL